MLSAALAAFVTGILTSVGPCAAPRMVAAASLASAGRAKLAAYFFGIICSYASLAGGAGILYHFAAYRTWVERALALALGAAGVAGLWATQHDACDQHAHASSVGVFSLGLTMGFLISPCCTPAVLSLLALSLQNGPFATALYLSAFALGQLTMPALLASMPSLRMVRRWFVVWREPVAVLSAALSLSLGGYYALLAW